MNPDYNTEEVECKNTQLKDIISLYRTGEQMLSEKYDLPGLFGMANLYIQQRFKEEEINSNITIFDILEKKMFDSATYFQKPLDD